MALSRNLFLSALLLAPAFSSPLRTEAQDRVVTLDVDCKLYVSAPTAQCGSLLVKRSDGTLLKQLTPLCLAGETLDLAAGRYLFAFAADPGTRNLALELSFVDSCNPKNMFSATFTRQAGGPLTLVYAGNSGGSDGDRRSRVSVNTPQDFLAFN
jgi:hypothetical protein